MLPADGLPAPGPDLWSRAAVLAALATIPLTSLLAPGAILLAESRPGWTVPGAAGVLVLAAAQAAALYTVADRPRRGPLIAFAAAAVLSVPAVGPAGTGEAEPWAWLGASIAGSAPLLVRPRSAAAIAGACVATAAALAVLTGGSVPEYVLITAGVGLGVAGTGALPLWLWRLYARAREGQAAQALLSVTRERLRFAGDVHDLLGHSLSVIMLKAELAERVAAADPGRAGAEAAEIRRLAATALAEMRQAVHGYRSVDLDAQLAAVEQVLRSAGVRCTVRRSGARPPGDVGARLAAVAREGVTNVLRHSRAGWCTIEIGDGEDGVRMVITNDGVRAPGPDRHSSGLDALAVRLGEAGGTLRTRAEAGVFTLEAVLPVPS